jgi:hypothetical protein
VPADEPGVEAGRPGAGATDALDHEALDELRKQGASLP